MGQACKPRCPHSCRVRRTSWISPRHTISWLRWFRGEAEQPISVPQPKKEQRTLGFNPVTAATAAGLLMDADELQKIADLLWERKQVILYGPPGTG